MHRLHLAQHRLHALQRTLAVRHRLLHLVPLVQLPLRLHQRQLRAHEPVVRHEERVAGEARQSLFSLAPRERGRVEQVGGGLVLGADARHKGHDDAQHRVVPLGQLLGGGVLLQYAHPHLVGLGAKEQRARADLHHPAQLLAHVALQARLVLGQTRRCLHCARPRGGGAATTTTYRLGRELVEPLVARLGEARTRGVGGALVRLGQQHLAQAHLLARLLGVALARLVRLV